MPNEPEISINPLKSDPSWPPTPAKVSVKQATATNADGELTHCPHCRHKLLTHRSIMCNWCGKPINDKNYLEKAAAERAAADAAVRERLAREAEKPQKGGLIAKLARTASGLLQNEDV